METLSTKAPPPAKQKKLMGILLIALSISWLFAIPFLPMRTEKEVNMPFLNHVEEPNLLVFFGFPGCSQVCLRNMPVLRDVYSRYQKQSEHSSLKVIFANIIPDMPPEISDAYAKGYHSDFIGISFLSPQKELVHLNFGVMLTDPLAEGEIKHQGNTYLLKRDQQQWKIQQVYTSSSLSVERVLNDLPSNRSI